MDHIVDICHRHVAYTFKGVGALILGLCLAPAALGTEVVYYCGGRSSDRGWETASLSMGDVATNVCIIHTAFQKNKSGALIFLCLGRAFRTLDPGQDRLASFTSTNCGE